MVFPERPNVSQGTQRDAGASWAALPPLKFPNSEEGGGARCTPFIPSPRKLFLGASISYFYPVCFLGKGLKRARSFASLQALPVQYHPSIPQTDPTKFYHSTDVLFFFFWSGGGEWESSRGVFHEDTPRVRDRRNPTLLCTHKERPCLQGAGLGGGGFYLCIYF